MTTYRFQELQLDGPALSASECPVRRRFSRLVHRTACPYARNARIIYAPPWEPQLSVEENTARAVPFLDLFVAHSATLCLDLFVMEVRNDPAVGDIGAMAQVLYRILGTLSQADPARVEQLTEGITTKEWDFVYRGERLFVPVFAPFYSANHPRYSHVPGSAYLVFQGDGSFKRRRISSRNPNRKQLTADIARLFLNGGFTYEVTLVTHPFKAARYLKPLRLSDEPIYWWE